MLKLKQIVNTPISSNCFVLYDKAVGNDCIIVDPGSVDNQTLYKFLEQNKLTPFYIILTHEHFDHCWGVNDLRDKYKEIKLVCSSVCSEAIQNKKKNYSAFNGYPSFELAPADILLEEVNWEIKWHDYALSFKPALGHSDSGIVFVIDKLMFTGDTLIKNVKTVLKLKTGSEVKLKKTMHMMSKVKGIGLIACPGHGLLFELDNYDLSKAFG